MSAAFVAGMAGAFPPATDQDALWSGFFADHFGGSRAARMAFASAGVKRRHAVANPLVEDLSTWSTARRMERFASEAPALAKEALAGALVDAGVDASEIGLLVVASCTGYATPGIDIQLGADLGMGDGVERLLVGHAGCHAALPGLHAACNYTEVRGRPAALLCLELTSLHVQPASEDLEQVVTHALFGDAAAATVILPETGGTSPLRLVDVAAATLPDTSDAMRWDVTDLGFRMGLSRRVPELAGRAAPEIVDRLLAAHGYERRDVRHWAVHPGGPRVLDSVGRSLELGSDALETSRAVLAARGNCSSATILLVLESLRPEWSAGDLVVALAFGPGLTCYAALFAVGGAPGD